MRSVMGESGTALGKDKVNDKMLICVKCLIDMSCEKNGVLVARDPHYIQVADLYKCPKCGAEILTGASVAWNWEYAEQVYNRYAQRYRDLYKMDTKEIFDGTTVEV